MGVDVNYRVKVVASLALSGFLLVNCAGRNPNPVSAHSPRDDAMNCVDINQEITDANRRMITLAEEQDSITNQNIILGVVAFLIFPPLAFAMDFKDAPATEMHGFDMRNRTLMGIASDRNCETVHAYSVKEAVKIAVGKNGAGDGVAPEGRHDTARDENTESRTAPQVAGAPVNTNMHSSYYPRNHGTTAQSSKPAPGSMGLRHGTNRPVAEVDVEDAKRFDIKGDRSAPVASGGNRPPTLKDLMGMFLRGEISREEYLQLRQGMKPG